MKFISVEKILKARFLNVSKYFVYETKTRKNAVLGFGGEFTPASRPPPTDVLPSPSGAREGVSSPPPPPHVPGRNFFFTPRRANQRHAADSSLKRTPAVSPSRFPIYTWGVQHRTSSLLVDLSFAVQRRPREPYAKNLKLTLCKTHGTVFSAQQEADPQIHTEPSAENEVSPSWVWPVDLTWYSEVERFFALHFQRVRLKTRGISAEKRPSRRCVRCKP